MPSRSRTSVSVRVAPVPQRDREHADQLVQRLLEAPGGDRFHNHFGVGMAAKRDARLSEGRMSSWL